MSPFTDASPNSRIMPGLIAAPKSIEPSGLLFIGWAEYVVPSLWKSSGYCTLNDKRAPPPISVSDLETHSV
jgi:hypothetical protein